MIIETSSTKLSGSPLQANLTCIYTILGYGKPYMAINRFHEKVWNPAPNDARPLLIIPPQSVTSKWATFGGFLDHLQGKEIAKMNWPALSADHFGCKFSSPGQVTCHLSWASARITQLNCFKLEPQIPRAQVYCWSEAAEMCYAAIRVKCEMKT